MLFWEQEKMGLNMVCCPNAPLLIGGFAAEVFAWHEIFAGKFQCELWEHRPLSD